MDTYEKKYNEALERAQKLDIDIAYTSYIFPEFRESEDERIRKWLIKTIHLIGVDKDICADQETMDKAISWLEKQKETPMPNSTELIEMWHDEKAMLKEKDFRGDEWRLAYNAFMDGFARGTCVKFEKQKEQENTSASTIIPSCHEELTEFELVLFNAVLDNNFVGAKGSENALAMTKKVAPALLTIAKKEPDWDREKCFVCQEYEKGFKQGHLEGFTAGYNKAVKEMEQKEQRRDERADDEGGSGR